MELPFPFDLRGPAFLLFYLAFAAAAIGGAVLVRRLLESGPAPGVDLSDPRLLACLRGGREEAVRVSAVSLADRGLLVLKGLDLRPKEGADPDLVRDPLDRAVLEHVGTGRSARSVAESAVLRDAVGPREETLRNRGLIASDRDRARRRLVAGLAIALLALVGGAKVVIGLSRDRPVVLLVLLMAAASIAAWVLVTRPRRTSRGDSLLRDARTLYSRLRARAAALSPGSGGTEAALLAAVFGFGALSALRWRTFASMLVPPRASSRARADGSAQAASCGFASVWSCGSSCGSSCGGGGGCGGCGS